MLRPNTLDVQRLRQLVQAAVQIVAELHEVLDVENLGEEKLQEAAIAGGYLH